MRSTAYSVMMTLLLLVPISAVPLMAIFGVPQFTPIVSSPLDETDDDEWDRPARKKSRSTAHVDDSDEDEDDVAADESLDWTDDAQERSRSLRKHRSKARAASQPLDERMELSFAESDGDQELKASPKKPPKKASPKEMRDNAIDEESSIQLTASDVVDESPFAASAAYEELQEPARLNDAADEAKIPGYRRQKSGSRLEADARESKPSSKKKKTAPPTEPLSWLQLSKRLNDFGIRNFRLESGEGEFTFTCTYTPSNSPHVTRKFEAIADDPLKAVAKVLAQVEEASQQKVMASPRRMSESRKPVGTE